MPLEYTLGWISFWVCIVAMLVYIVAIIVGRVDSSKIAWGIWCPVSGMVCFSSYQTNGATETLLEFIAYFIGTIATFALLLFLRKESQWTWGDTVCLAGVCLILALWSVLSPITTMNATLAVDIFGSAFLIVNAYRAPRSEYAPAWILGFSANAINLFAVKHWDFANAAYPVYLAVMTFTMATLVSFPKLLRRTKTA